MEISKPYTLTLVDTDVDFIVIKNPYCIRCFTRKMNCNILSFFIIIYTIFVSLLSQRLTLTINTYILPFMVLNYF